MTRKDQYLKTQTLIPNTLVNLRDILIYNLENFQKFLGIPCKPSIHVYAANQYIFQRFNLSNFHNMFYWYALIIIFSINHKSLIHSTASKMFLYLQLQLEKKNLMYVLLLFGFSFTWHSRITLSSRRKKRPILNSL